MLLESLAKVRASAYFANLLTPAIVEELTGFYDTDSGAQSPATFDSASKLAGRYARYYHHAVPFGPGALHDAWRRCAENDARCRARLDEVSAQGLGRERFTSR